MVRLTPLPLMAVLSVMLVTAAAFAQNNAAFDNAGQARQALRQARSEAEAARIRGERLEAEARKATAAAEKTARQAAALAARIQQAEAGIAAAEARIVLIGAERVQLDKRLAERRGPLIRLTGALQRLSRRPLALSAMRPGSLRETVYLRAMLEGTIPEVQRRTAALRGELERASALEREAQQAIVALRASETELATRRKELVALESRQRLESRQAEGEAYRETERALALAEQARDLDSLIETFNAAGSLRSELARLPGPVMRPARPQSAGAVTIDPVPASTGTANLAMQLPATGRTIAGFGAETSAGTRNQGITLAPRAGAQIVAPAAGRVAFAGPYRGYGRMTIIEHDNGLTSLITGLARVDVTVGMELVAGSPLGIAGPSRPTITFELRKRGKPVNPLDYIK